MAVTKKILSQYDVKLVTEWHPPVQDAYGEVDMRPLIAMPNIPKPTHGLAPRTLLGSATWNRMRKHAYAQADDTCEICSALYVISGVSILVEPSLSSSRVILSILKSSS